MTLPTIDELTDRMETAALHHDDHPRMTRYSRIVGTAAVRDMLMDALVAEATAAATHYEQRYTAYGDNSDDNTAAFNHDRAAWLTVQKKAMQ
ncbi:MAG TPA: hypothetical protein VNJ04_19575 [Gemmatimonadaceae bacterium]|nr:hypothetical protein [Gemmatimonadaceae bacterium]